MDIPVRCSLPGTLVILSLRWTLGEVPHVSKTGKKTSKDLPAFSEVDFFGFSFNGYLRYQIQKMVVIKFDIKTLRIH